jgi:hypothetical protein
MIVWIWAVNAWEEDLQYRQGIEPQTGWRHVAEQATIDWRFSVTDSRKKLKRLYLSLPS